MQKSHLKTTTCEYAPLVTKARLHMQVPSASRCHTPLLTTSCSVHPCVPPMLSGQNAACSACRLRVCTTHTHLHRGVLKVEGAAEEHAIISIGDGKIPIGPLFSRIQSKGLRMTANAVLPASRRCDAAELVYVGWQHDVVAFQRCWAVLAVEARVEGGFNCMRTVRACPLPTSGAMLMTLRALCPSAASWRSRKATGSASGSCREGVCTRPKSASAACLYAHERGTALASSAPASAHKACSERGQNSCHAQHMMTTLSESVE